jgi:glutathione S-transferase
MAVGSRGAPRGSVLKLITIPFSHYNERARWALDICGVSYCEEPSAPVLHTLHVMAAGGGSGAKSKDTRIVSGSFSTPCAVLPDGQVVTDSKLICRYASQESTEPSVDLYPAAHLDDITMMENRFHDHVGRYARTAAYWGLRSDELYYGTTVIMLPPSQRKIGSWIMWAIRPMIFGGLRINERTAERARGKLSEEFAWVSERLEGKEWLCGEHFTAADLAFAALAAPVLGISEAEGNVAVPSYPAVDALPAETRDFVRVLRATPAGQHALKTYREQRPRILRRTHIVDRPEILQGLLLASGGVMLLLAIIAREAYVFGRHRFSRL